MRIDASLAILSSKRPICGSGHVFPMTHLLSRERAKDRGNMIDIWEKSATEAYAVDFLMGDAPSDGNQNIL
jgi:hypothetical protein